MISSGARPRTSYIIRDTFSIDTPSIDMSNSISTGIANNRLIVDSEEKISIIEGKLTISGPMSTQTQGDPGLQIKQSVYRTGGLLLFGDFAIDSTINNIGSIGIDNNTSGLVNMHAIYPGFLGSTPTLNLLENSSGVNGLVPMLNIGQRYQFVIVFRRFFGAFYFIKGGDFTHQTLIFSSKSSSTNPFYVGVSGYRGAFNCDYLELKTQYQMPIPILSDGFSCVDNYSNNGRKSDGMGHTESLMNMLGKGGRDVTQYGSTGTLIEMDEVNLCINGGFDIDSNQSKNNAIIEDGVAKIIGDNGGYIQPTVTILERGKQYDLTFSIDGYSSKNAGLSSITDSKGFYPNENGTFSYRFFSHNTTLRLISDTSGVTFDNIIVREVNAKRLKITSIYDNMELFGNPTLDTDSTQTKGTGQSISNGVATKVSGVQGDIYQSVVENNKQYRHSFDIVSITSGQFNCRANSTTVGGARTEPGSYVCSFRGSAVRNCGIYASSTTNGSVDNISLKEIDIKSTFSSVQLLTPDVIGLVNMYNYLTSTQMGFAFNIDNPLNPQNFTLIYFDSAQIKLDKCVDGTYTNVTTVSASFNSLYDFQVIKRGNIYLVYNNLTQIGSTAIVNEPTIINNLYYALFSTHTETSIYNLFDNCRFFASGTNGEYDELQNILELE